MSGGRTVVPWEGGVIGKNQSYRSRGKMNVVTKSGCQGKEEDRVKWIYHPS
jgi:hypothetical protein